MRYNTNHDQRQTNNGIYQLLIYMPQKNFIRVGKRGSFEFPAGYYVYTGSAKKGLKARISRHLKEDKRKFWHIDYLLPHARIKEIVIHPQKSECDWNGRLARLKEARIPVQGFGSSDCKCVTHLLYFKRRPILNSTQQASEIWK